MSSSSSVWVAQGVHCPICRGKHDLCFSHEPQAAGVYKLTCPNTGQAHDITLPAPAKESPACPTGSIPIDLSLG